MIRNLLGSTAAASLAVVAAAGCTTAPGSSGSPIALSTIHTRDVVRDGTANVLGHVPAASVMSLDLVLPLGDADGLTAYAAAVSDPTSASYGQFLTVDQFTETFGPAQADYDAVLAFATEHGLTVTGGTRDGLDVQVTGSVSAIEAAFHVNMMQYVHPTESRTFFAPDREPTAEVPLWHVSGLDNFSIPHPMLVTRDARDQVENATTGSGPSASFLGTDMRAAYYGGSALTGAGQTLGLFEFLGTDLADLKTYFANVHQTNSVPISVVSTDGTSTACTYPSCDDTEQTLDMTQALGMAPGLSGLVMFVGSTDTAIISDMTTRTPLATTIGCSWGWTPADPTTLDPYFEKMAAQGQTFFAASGDDSTWSKRNEAWPADDANVVSVGGTDLSTKSAGGAWASETAWSDSGGGISPDKIAIPAWQKLSGVIDSSNKGSTKYRNGPDVSANANFTFYVCADQTTCTANDYGGTSFATPMWAGVLALVNQQRAADGKKAIGFINPLIYAANITSSYGSHFHDITSGKSGSYSAVKGYDLVTGWGSPQPALVSWLAAQ